MISDYLTETSYVKMHKKGCEIETAHKNVDIEKEKANNICIKGKRGESVMLKKFKNQVTVLGIMGFIGTGSMFSGLAAQNVCAEESAAEANVTVTQGAETSSATGLSSESLTATGHAGNTDGDTSAEKTEKTEKENLSDEVFNSSDNDAAEEKISSISENAENRKSAVEEKVSKTDIEEAGSEEIKKTGGVGAVKYTGAVQAVKNGWVKEKGGYKYYKNGRAYTGWHKMGKAEGEKTEHYSYFGKDGIIRTGWQSMGKGTKNAYNENSAKHMSYFGKDGWLRTGWQSMGKNTGNTYEENTAKHMSYFGKNGWLRTGWQSMGNNTKNSYDENTTQHMSYFGKNGWLRKGWQSMGKGTKNSYDENTAKHMSYFGGNGWLRTGLQEMGKGTNNSYEENTLKHRSFFGNNGWLKSGKTLTISGKKYYADNRGWLSLTQDEAERSYSGIIQFYKNNVPRDTKKYMTGNPFPEYENEVWLSLRDHEPDRYLIKDIDGNGVPELIVLCKYYNRVSAIYTLSGNKVKPLAFSMYRTWFSLDNNGVCYAWNHVSADEYTIEIFKMSNDGVSLISNRSYSHQYGNPEKFWKEEGFSHTYLGNYSTGNIKTTTISAKEFNAIENAYNNAVCKGNIKYF